MTLIALALTVGAALVAAALLVGLRDLARAVKFTAGEGATVIAPPSEIADEYRRLYSVPDPPAEDDLPAYE